MTGGAGGAELQILDGDFKRVEVAEDPRDGFCSPLPLVFGTEISYNEFVALHS